MFWSKIWFFLVAVLAAVAITIALVLPQPAERATNVAEKRRLARACSVANILLRDSARKRVQLAGEFARAAAPEGAPKLRLGTILYEASKSASISQAENSTGKKALIELLKGEGKKPSMVVLLDAAGRVVARAGPDASKYGDSLRGYFLVDDALDGYLRDDLWVLDGKLYRVAASPVVTSRVPADWAGAVILGSPIDNDFATSLEKSLGVFVSFYANNGAIASSSSVQIHEDILANFGAMADVEPGKDCSEGEPFDVVSGGKTYSAMISRLPGEAGDGGAFFALFLERESGVGFMGTLDTVRKDDLSFATFPWIKLGIAFLLVVGIGIGLMILEADRPLRRLAADTVRLAQGEAERLDEEKYRGKVGSIARSVNIAIDKLGREAKSARKELDQLLGPLPGSGEMPVARPMPASGPMGPSPQPFTPPPPSEFKFGGAPGPGPATSGPSSGPSDFELDLPPAPPALAQTMHGQPQRQAPMGNPTSGGAPPPPPVRAPTDQPTPPPPITLPKDPKRINRPPTPDPVVSAIDEDILSTHGPTLVKPPPDHGMDNEMTVVSDQSEKLASGDAEGVYFREIFDEFLAMKRKCGENTDNLTFDKFAAKLRTNRDALIAKHGCRSVKFQVYIKDGKAALKASPTR